MKHRMLAAMMVGIALSTIAVPAAAQSPDSKEALARFEGAITLYDKKDYEGALARFKEAYAGSKSPNARLYIARCLRELGRLGEAHAEMSGVLAEATARAPKEPRYAQTRDAASNELAALERTVALINITVEGAGDDFEVRLGDEKLTKDQLGKPLVRKPGKVTVEASSKGKKTISRQIDLVAGQRQSVALAFGDSTVVETPAAPLAPTAPDRPKPDAPTTSGGNPALLISGVVVAVLGIGGVVTFAVTGSMAKSKFDEVEEGCGGVRCTDPTYADVISSGRTLSTVANATLGVGIACAVGGAIMIGVGWPRGGAKQTPHVAFGASWEHAGLTLSQSF